MRLSKPSPSMLVAGTALFVALGGVAYAGVTLSNNSVRSNHIVNGQVKTADLANSAVTAAKLRLGAVTSAKVRDGGIEAVDLSAAAQAALRGQTGPAGAAGPAGPATGAAGGALTGSYPNPQIAPGAVGSTQLAANEAWHVIGGAGEPAFQNGWANSPLGVQPFSARFRKDVAGTIHLAGQITGGTISCALGTAVFDLPVGYRPTADRFFTIASTNGANVPSPATLFISSAGDVQVCAGNSTYVSLDGVSFIP